MSNKQDLAIEDFKKILEYSDDILEEAKRLMKEGFSDKEAYRKALTEYIDFCEKPINNNKFTCILSENEDIDNENEEIFDKNTGETLRVLE